MKKNIIKIGILSLALTVISTIFIITMGRTHTATFISKSKNDILIVQDNSIIEVLKKEKKGEEYIVKFKGKKPGRVFLLLEKDDYSEEKLYYVHKSMVITDNSYFGYARGSEIIPISISIVLLYTLYILIQRYRESCKNNLYQYRNVAYLGIIIFFASWTLSNILSLFHYQGVYDTVDKTINSVSLISFYLLPIAIITFILVTISNIRLIKKEGVSFRNMFGLFLGIITCLLPLVPDRMYNILLQSQKFNIYNLNSLGPYLYNFIEALIYLVVAYLECILIGTIVIAIKSVKKKVELNKDYIIILGCKIKKDGSLTPLLKGRVDRALAFRNEQLKETGKDLIFVTSGGKGDDEIISEAKAMKDYLIENGIKEKNIILESKSTNTYQNIKNSYKLINNKEANVAFATTNYHVFRAGLLATAQGLKLEGVGSPTKAYFWINAFIREFIGTLYSERKKHIIVSGIIIIIIAVMISITYFANNI